MYKMFMYVGHIQLDMTRGNDKKRAKGGEFTTRVSLEDVLGVFEQVEGPIVTTGDVADTYDCSSESARQKLFTLEEQGRVKRRKPGQQSFWWRTDNDEEERNE
jgi:Fic family protein